jgi:hypothetical protein
MGLTAKITWQRRPFSLIFAVFIAVITAETGLLRTARTATQSAHRMGLPHLKK